MDRERARNEEIARATSTIARLSAPYRRHFKGVTAPSRLSTVPPPCCEDVPSLRYDAHGISWTSPDPSLLNYLNGVDGSSPSSDAATTAHRRMFHQLSTLLCRPMGQRFREDWIERRPCPSGTEPAALIGASGVFVKRSVRRLPCFSIVAIYEGRPTTSVRVPMIHPHGWAPLAESPTMLATQHLPALLKTGSIGKHVVSWQWDGQLIGNECAPFINDYRVNVHYLGDPANDPSRINVVMTSVMVKGVPYLILVTTKSIVNPRGRATQLWMDYGPAYWTSFGGVLDAPPSWMRVPPPSPTTCANRPVGSATVGHSPRDLAPGIVVPNGISCAIRNRCHPQLWCLRRRTNGRFATIVEPPRPCLILHLPPHGRGTTLSHVRFRRPPQNARAAEFCSRSNRCIIRCESVAKAPPLSETRSRREREGRQSRRENRHQQR